MKLLSTIAFRRAVMKVTRIYDRNCRDYQGRLLLPSVHSPRAKLNDFDSAGDGLDLTAMEITDFRDLVSSAAMNPTITCASDAGKPVNREAQERYIARSPEREMLRKADLRSSCCKTYRCEGEF
jgi:hypothetical protein